MEVRLHQQLIQRRRDGNLRSFLPIEQLQQSSLVSALSGGAKDNDKGEAVVDFSSNDYLGLARCPRQACLVESSFSNINKKSNANAAPLQGATGSRLLSGDSLYCRRLEKWLAKIHNRSAALMMNSGYDANLSVLSSLVLSTDVVICDELVHNSILMGLKMSRLSSSSGYQTFSHNNVSSLQRILERQHQQHGEQQELSKARHHKDYYPNELSSNEYKATPPQILIVVESVYSMDGDVAPLTDIFEVALRYHARVIVDEAHGLGVYGRTNPNDLQLSENQKKNFNLNSSLPLPPRRTEIATAEIVSTETSKELFATAIETVTVTTTKTWTPVPTEDTNIRTTSTMHIATTTNDVNLSTVGGTGVLAALQLESHPSLLCSVHTFGKAAGCHGAVVCGSKVLIEYLINYARPFIYSTAMPPHSLASIQASYETMLSTRGDALRKRVFANVTLFRNKLLAALSSYDNNKKVPISLWPSPSPIQALVVPGNDTCIAYCRTVLQQSGGSIRLYPIRSPTVPRGQERVRIILHAHNTTQQVEQLVDILLETLRDMNLIQVDWDKVLVSSKL